MFQKMRKKKRDLDEQCLKLRGEIEEAKRVSRFVDPSQDNAQLEEMWVAMTFFGIQRRKHEAKVLDSISG